VERYEQVTLVGIGVLQLLEMPRNVRGAVKGRPEGVGEAGHRIIYPNIKAVLLDTAADAGAAAGVAVTGAIIFVTGRWNWLDPAVALAIAVVIGYHAGGLIWRVLGALGIRTRDDTNT
jgi:hypothetical protein